MSADRRLCRKARTEQPTPSGYQAYRGSQSYSTTVMPHRTSALPTELWLEILRWATLESWTYRLYSTKYHPFEAIDVHISTVKTRYTKRALVLVCKQWWQWTMPFLYEDIVLLPRAYRPLGRLLRHGQEWADGTIIPPCAPFVRRAHLPYSTTVTPSPLPLAVLGSLKLCSSLQVLVRTADAIMPLPYEFSVDCPPFPSLKRLDWWHHNEAARTGGINSLPHVLELAPNVEYLSVGGEVWANYLNTPQVHLPRLATLRFWRVNAFYMLKICRWRLPALRHVIFDSIVNAEIVSPFWTTFGPQIQTVELGINLKFFVLDFLPHVLVGCPQLEELNYYVLFTQPPRVDGDAAMESLKVVGLHAHPSSFFRVGSPEYWSHMGRHFDALAQAAFPALKRIALYGDWSAVIDDDEFHRITQPLQVKGCIVEMA